jgi:hypothetical protein
VTIEGFTSSLALQAFNVRAKLVKATQSRPSHHTVAVEYCGSGAPLLAVVPLSYARSSGRLA